MVSTNCGLICIDFAISEDMIFAVGPKNHVLAQKKAYPVKSEAIPDGMIFASTLFTRRGHNKPQIN